MTVKIKVSEINSFGYCERSLALDATRPKRSIKPRAMVKGIAAHDKIDEYFLNQTKRTMKLHEFLATKRRIRSRPGASRVMLVHEFEGIRLVGFIDELISDIVGIHVVDDKPGTFAYEGQKNQVRTYAYLVQENFKDKIDHKPIYSMLRNYHTGQFIWREKFTPEVEEEVLKIIYKIRDLKLGTYEPKKSGSHAKCGACKHQVVCNNA